MKSFVPKSIIFSFLFICCFASIQGQETCIIQEAYQLDEEREQLIIPYQIIRNGKVKFTIVIENRYGIQIENIKACTFYKDKGGNIQNVKKGSGSFVWEYAKDGYSLKEVENPNNESLSIHFFDATGKEIYQASFTGSQYEINRRVFGNSQLIIYRLTNEAGELIKADKLGLF